MEQKEKELCRDNHYFGWFFHQTDFEKCNTWICWFKVILDLSLDLFFSALSRVSGKKWKFGISLKCIEAKKKLDSFYSYAQKQRDTRKKVRRGICGETSYRFIEFYSNAKWLTFEYHRKKIICTRVKEKRVEEVNCVKHFCRFNFHDSFNLFSTAWRNSFVDFLKLRLIKSSRRVFISHTNKRIG